MSARPAIDRLLERVTETPGPLDTPCWITTYALSNGYARMNDRGKNRRCHTVAYEALVGPIPEGLRCDHLCRVRACCNPAHIEPVTARENNRRGFSPNWVAHNTNTCKRGHSLEDAYVRPYGRVCRACRRIVRPSRSRRT